jgi:hypothetical protein
MRKLDRKKLKIVDGSRIRNSLDIEFGVVGDRSLYPYIKPGDVWLEKYFLPEKDAILANFRRKQALTRKYGYEAAKARLRPRKIDRQAVKYCHLQKLGRFGKASVHLVDGRLVRQKLDPNFCFGGHYLVYKYVPRGEVWLDNAVDLAELRFVAIHELFELDLMRGGKDYTNAHEFANAAEKEARRAGCGAVYPKD